jgi:hypothetical protein
LDLSKFQHCDNPAAVNQAPGFIYKLVDVVDLGVVQAGVKKYGNTIYDDATYHYERKFWLGFIRKQKDLHKPPVYEKKIMDIRLFAKQQTDLYKLLVAMGNKEKDIQGIGMIQEHSKDIMNSFCRELKGDLNKLIGDYWRINWNWNNKSKPINAIYLIGPVLEGSFGRYEIRGQDQDKVPLPPFSSRELKMFEDANYKPGLFRLEPILLEEVL